MKNLLCGGLDGANPLHFLASLGVLRLLALRDADVGMSWEWRGGWRPEYHWICAEAGEPIDVAAGYLGAWLRELGSVGKADATLDRRIRDLAAALKKLREERTALAKEARSAAKNRKLRGDDAKALEIESCAVLDREITEKQILVEELQGELNNSLGNGIAHLGDIIGVPAQLFRVKAEAAVAAWLEPVAVTEPCRDHPLLVVEALAAHACDVVTDSNGKVQPTPYSFSNGSSGQCLLKDFRGCALNSTDEMVSGLLRGEPITSGKVTGLNWNPADQRSYALQWQDPSSGADDDPAVNALAFVGMSLLSAIPVGSNLGAIGWVMARGENGFVWPIWVEAIGLEEVRGLLGIIPSLAKQPQDIAPMGIHVLMKSARINPTGKRNFFAPANTL